MVDITHPKFPGFVSNYWLSGGETGGNCYGDEPNMELDAEDECPLYALDEFLTLNFPTLTANQQACIHAAIQTRCHTYNKLVSY